MGLLTEPRARPLSDDDRQNLADPSHMQDDEDELLPRSDQRDGGRVCIREAGHEGRHKHRPVNGTAN